MDIDIKEVRKLSNKFSPEQIEACITQHLETGENICLMNKSTEETISELAEAEFIGELMKKGMSLADALRELARRMRQLHEGFEGEQK
jgi:hypothetical protein